MGFSINQPRQAAKGTFRVEIINVRKSSIFMLAGMQMNFFPPLLNPKLILSGVDLKSVNQRNLPRRKNKTSVFLTFPPRRETGAAGVA